MFFVVSIVIGLIAFLLFESCWEGSGEYDAHYTPPPPARIAAVPRALLAKPANDVTPFPVDAETQPAARRKRQQEAA